MKLKVFNWFKFAYITNYENIFFTDGFAFARISISGKLQQL